MHNEIEAKRRISILKNLLTIILLLFFLWVLYRNLDDFRTLYNTIQKANPLYLLNAMFLGVANFILLSFVFQSSFKLISNDTKYPNLFAKSVIYHFLTLSNPLGTAGSSAYLINYLVERGLSHIKAVFGILVANLSLNFSFLLILAFTLYNLSIHNKLEEYQWVAAGLVFGINLGLILLIIFFVITPKFSARMAYKITAFINKITTSIIKKDLFSTKTVEEYTHEARSLSDRFDRSIYNFIKNLPLPLAYHGINILILFLSFYSFDILIPLAGILTLYGVIMLFTVVSPTPQGIGIVEGLSYTAAVSVGIGPSEALFGILIYRVAVVWIPALLGLSLFKWSTGEKSG
ncbi:flippase-like domain-containing protein [Candidatus Dojkabacteria bacterium]|nr:flippase-like domain-containing protein [Candidatus Dojkabacteria bacterium]